MPMPEPEPEPSECICCTNWRDLERRGDEWFCPVCSRTWFALSVDDKVRLKIDHIKAEC